MLNFVFLTIRRGGVIEVAFQSLGFRMFDSVDQARGNSVMCRIRRSFGSALKLHPRCMLEQDRGFTGVGTGPGPGPGPLRKVALSAALDLSALKIIDWGLAIYSLAVAIHRKVFAILPARQQAYKRRAEGLV